MNEFPQAGYAPSQYQLDAWMRRQRGPMLIGSLQRMACRIADRIRAAATLIVARRERTETLHGLLLLDDRRLADIGLTRGAAEFALGGTLRGLYTPRRPVAVR